MASQSTTAKAVLTLAAAVTLWACSDDEKSYEGLSLSDGGSTIMIDRTWKQCETATDCVRVGTSCDGCCGEDAVAATRESEYRDASRDLCEGYQGGVCDCQPLPTTVECVESICTLVGQ